MDDNGLEYHKGSQQHIIDWVVVIKFGFHAESAVLFNNLSFDSKC